MLPSVSEWLLVKALTIQHISQPDDVCRSEYLFLDRAERHSLGGLPSPTTPNCRPIAPPLKPPPSCSTFSPGSSEVSECGWVCGRVGWCLATVTVRLNAGSLSPLWSQPVSCWASQAAAESVSLWRKWRLEELDQTPPITGFLWGGGAGFTHYQR